MTTPTSPHDHVDRPPGGIEPNSAGQPSIAYRSDVHGVFLQRMIDRLGDPNRPALGALTTRGTDDVSLGLIDALASMGDVLTFYQERIANEHYLTTATETLSLRELAALVDYRFSPGKAADVHLAFELDTAPGSPTEVILEPGITAESIPKPGETLEAFETIDEFTARPEWNLIRPRMHRPLAIEEVKEHGWALVSGLGLNISVGDRIMIVVDDDGEADRALETVELVTEDPATQTTRLEFSKTPGFLMWEAIFLTAISIAPLTTMTTTSANVYDTEWIGLNVAGAVWNQTDLVAQASVTGQSIGVLGTALLATAITLVVPGEPPPVVEGLSVFRTSASVFGHDALPMEQRTGPAAALPDTVLTVLASDQPSDLANEIIDGDRLPLASSEKGIIDDSWMAFETAGWTGATFRQAENPDERTVERYQRTAKVTTVGVASLDGIGTRGTRDTTVHAEPEALVLADLPITDDVMGDSIVLERANLLLAVGQTVAVTGERADLEGVTAVEIRTLKELKLASGVTVLTFDVPLEHRYRRETVTIAANVVRATHGKHVDRVLGSGNATATFQRFTLPDRPLTYVAADTASGVASTLEVRVNGIRWDERDNLATSLPDDSVYMTRQLENGSTQITFGDGLTGARLPTGLENVTASYRVGRGRPGLVDTGQISLLATKPLGVKSVVNPAPSFDAAPATTLEEARIAAPSRVMTLGRIVSLRDHADFVRNVTGVNKAHASWVWVGERREVVVSIAGVDGATFPVDHPKLATLATAVAAAGDGSIRSQIVSYRPATFVLAMQLVVDDAYDSEVVVADVTTRLRENYAFERRVLGAPVFRGEIIATAQATPGVIAVDLDAFDRTGVTPSGLASRLLAGLPARGNRLEQGDAIEGAELLLLDPRPIDITVREVRSQ